MTTVSESLSLAYGCGCAVGVAIDVTERRMAEEALYEFNLALEK